MDEYGLDFMRGHQSMYDTPSKGLFDSLLGNDSFLGSSEFSNSLGALGGIADFGMGLWQMSNQGDLMDMYNDQLDMSKEQWGITKEELGRLKKVRQNLSAGYNQGGNYQAQAQMNPSETPSQYLK